ncbi:MAG: SEL1-like repeat protein [Proteobacteria bacterium]|nr:SEL1-like repeat protein [Pseudomonadota bacterium]
MTVLHRIFLLRGSNLGRQGMVFCFLLGCFFLVSSVVSSAASDNPDLVKTIQEQKKEIINGVACSSDGKKIAAAGDDGNVRVWDIASGKIMFTLGKDLLSADAVAFSPDGQLLAAAVSAGGRRGHAVQVWDLATGQLMHDMREHTQLITDLDFSPDGNRIASVGNDNTLRIWNVKYGTLETTQKETKNNLLAVAYSPDGRNIVATENWDGKIEMWDAVNVRLIRSIQGHADWVLCVAYSPDGKEFVTGSRDGSVYVWNAESGARLRVLRDPELDAVNSVAYSPDGRYVVAATQSRNILSWPKTGGKLFNFYTGHDLSVTSLAFSSGKHLVSAGLDGSIRVWNAPGQGGPDSLYVQAMKYEAGTDPMEQDLALAANLYQQAAEQGQVEAMFRLGTLYSQGKGVVKNPDESRKWWTLAAEKGHSSAKAQLLADQKVVTVVAASPPQAKIEEPHVQVQAEPKSMEPEDKKIRVAVKEPAKMEQIAKVVAPPAAKDKNTLYEEGLRFFKGEGVARNYSQAYKLFVEAAEMGQAKAQYRLGFMFSLGRGVKKSDQEAVIWWQKAAKQNDPEAQYYLGYMYEIGGGVKQDMDEAKKWYQKAAANGSINAAQSLKMIP